MDKGAKIYVAGHRGMVGGAIVRNLTGRGYTNIVVRTHAELDLTDQRAVGAFFAHERPEYVFLAAAKVGGIVANNTERGAFLYENMMIEMNVIHASHVYGVRKLMFLGSSCIYPRHAEQPISEDALLTGLLEPTNEPYAVAKIAGIKLCEAYRAQYGSDFVSVMPTNLYGPGDNYDLRASHVLPAMLRKMHLGRLLMQGDEAAVRRDMNFRPIDGVDGRVDWPLIVRTLAGYGVSDARIELWGTGTPLREFLHAHDMADATVYVMLNYSAPQHINVGSGEEHSIGHMAEMIAQVVGYDGLIIWNTDKPDGMPRKLMDSSRLSHLGWRPSIALGEGLRSVYAHYCRAVDTQRP